MNAYHVYITVYSFCATWFPRCMGTRDKDNVLMVSPLVYRCTLSPPRTLYVNHCLSNVSGDCGRLTVIIHGLSRYYLCNQKTPFEHFIVHTQ